MLSSSEVGVSDVWTCVDSLAEFFDRPAVQPQIEVMADDEGYWPGDPMFVPALLAGAEDMRSGCLFVETLVTAEEDGRWWRELGERPPLPSPGEAVWVTEVSLVLVRGKGAFLVNASEHEELADAIAETMAQHAWLLSQLGELEGRTDGPVPLGSVTLFVARDVSPEEVPPVAQHMVVGRSELVWLPERLRAMALEPAGASAVEQLFGDLAELGDFSLGDTIPELLHIELPRWLVRRAP